MIIDIEVIENMIIAIEDGKDDSSVQSHVLMRPSSLIMSDSNELLLNTFKTKILCYKNKVKKI